MRVAETPLRCPHCGLVLVFMEETQPTVYRYCPKCGERHLYWDREALKLKEDKDGAQGTA